MTGITQNKRKNMNSMTHILKPLLNNVDSGYFWALDPDLISITTYLIRISIGCLVFLACIPRFYYLPSALQFIITHIRT